MSRHRFYGHAASARQKIAVVVGMFGAAASVLLVLGGVLGGVLVTRYQHGMPEWLPTSRPVVRVAASWHPDKATMVISLGVTI